MWSSLLLLAGYASARAIERSIDLSSGNLTAEEYLAHPDGDALLSEHLTARDVLPNCNVKIHTRKVGDGHPHQNYIITQIATPIVGCPHGSLSSGLSHTQGWSISLSLNPGFEKSDIGSLGASYTDSNTVTTSESFTCDSFTGQICALHYTAVTALTVDILQVGCKNPAPSTRAVVYLPNANGIGSFVRRGASIPDKNIIQCRGTSERTVDFYCGPPGGPEWWDTRLPGPDNAEYLAKREPAGCNIPIEAYNFKD